MLKLLPNKLVQILIICLLVFLSYSNVFRSQFTAEDLGYVANWETAAYITPQNIRKILTIESVPGEDRGVYRPVKSLFIMFSRYLWGGNPFGYHVDAVLIHIINTVLVYLIVGQLTERTLLAVTRTTGSGKLLPMLTALIFGLHPIQTEAVTFITASFDSLGWTFYLTAFFCWLKGRRFVSLIFAGLAFFTYELTLTLPFVLILADYILIRKRISAEKKPVVNYLPYFAVLLFYLIVRFLLLDAGTRGSYLGDSFYKTQLVMTFAWVEYLKTIIWPVNLTIDHKLLPGIYSVVYTAFVNQETLNNLSILSMRVLVNLGILGGLLGFGIYFWKKLPIITFGIFWFFVTLSPAAFLLPQSSVMAERYAYVAVFGWSLLLGYLLLLIYNLQFTIYNQFSIFKHLNLVRVSGLVFFLGLIVFYSAKTYIRNEDYRDTLTFWQKLADQSVDNAITNYTLAKIYADRGSYNVALSYFDKALTLAPGNIEISYRAGKMYELSGRADIARAYFKLALNSENRYSGFAKFELLKLEDFEGDKLLFSGGNTGEGSGGWARLKFGDISFEYPIRWLIAERQGEIIFDDPVESLTVTVGGNKVASGKLVNEGPVVIENVREANVRVWDREGIAQMEFFLADGVRDVRVFMWPANSAAIGDFNRFLGSITFNVN